VADDENADPRDRDYAKWLVDPPGNRQPGRNSPDLRPRPVGQDITAEHPNRTFALVELLVRAPWRRQHVAASIHRRLLADRIEERATLTVLPAAEAAHAAYRAWGWQKVAQKRNPLPGSPLFDVMLKPLVF